MLNKKEKLQNNNLKIFTEHFIFLTFYQTLYTNKAQSLDPLLESGMYFFLYK